MRTFTCEEVVDLLRNVTSPSKKIPVRVDSLWGLKDGKCRSALETYNDFCKDNPLMVPRNPTAALLKEKT